MNKYQIQNNSYNQAVFNFFKSPYIRAAAIISFIFLPTQPMFFIALAFLLISGDVKINNYNRLSSRMSFLNIVSLIMSIMIILGGSFYLIMFSLVLIGMVIDPPGPPISDYMPAIITLAAFVFIYIGGQTTVAIGFFKFSKAFKRRISYNKGTKPVLVGLAISIVSLTIGFIVAYIFFRYAFCIIAYIPFYIISLTFRILFDNEFLMNTLHLDFFAFIFVLVLCLFPIVVTFVQTLKYKRLIAENNITFPTNPINTPTHKTPMHKPVYAAAVKYCSNCGTRQAINNQFCSNCGRKI